MSNVNACGLNININIKKNRKIYEYEKNLLKCKPSLKKSVKCAPCEDRTHDLQITTLDYETDALPAALTRH